LFLLDCATVQYTLQNTDKFVSVCRERIVKTLAAPT
jgi:hypothetical protein